MVQKMVNQSREISSELSDSDNLIKSVLPSYPRNEQNYQKQVRFILCGHRVLAEKLVRMR